MKIRAILLTTYFTVIGGTIVSGQSVSINSTGAVADTSAMLDIQSSEKGVLIPRMTSFQREAIFEPAEGLLVFDSDTRSFWFRQNNQWSELVSGKAGLRDMDHDTRVEVETSPDEDVIRFTTAGYQFAMMDGQRFEVGNDTGSIYMGKGAAPGADAEVAGNTIIGNQAGQSLTSGRSNTFIGNRAGMGVTVSSRSVAIGDSALMLYGPPTNTAVGFAAGQNIGSTNNAFFGFKAGQLAGGGNQTFVGAEAGKNAQGANNTIMGYQSGAAAGFIGHSNAFFGVISGWKNTSGSMNTFIGSNCAVNNLTGTNNTFIGFHSAHNNTTGSYKVAVGDSALLNSNSNNLTAVGHAAGMNSNDIRSTFVGYNAGKLAAGSNSTHVGFEAGYLDAGQSNTIIGTQAGNDTLVGNFNTLVGRWAGSDLRTGAFNTFVGESSGLKTTTGLYNVFIGKSTGKDNTAGIYNTFLGSSAGQTQRFGNYNTYVGTAAGYGTSIDTSGSSNTFVGAHSGYKVRQGFRNTLLGSQAGYYLTDGSRNTIVGTNAGTDITTGERNVLIGDGTGFFNSTGGLNTIIGEDAGVQLFDGFNNTLIGQAAGYYVHTGNFNVALGDSSLYDIDSMSQLVAIGHAAGMHAIDSFGTFVGYEAGRNNTRHSVTLIGYKAGLNNAGLCNTFLGAFSGQNDTITGGFNTFLGYWTGNSNTTGNNNVFAGSSTGGDNTTGYQNAFFGSQAGLNNTTGYGNTFIGYSTGKLAQENSANTFVGTSAGLSNHSGDVNTFVGATAGQGSTTGSNNSYLGYGAGLNSGAGSDNTYIGSFAGAQSSGSNNVFIGKKAGELEFGDYKLYIANGNTSNPLIYGEFDNSIATVHGELGINTKTPNREVTIFDTDDDGDAGLNLKSTNSESREMLILVDQANGGLISMQTNNDLRFRTNATNRLIVKSDGMVGIGTTTPPELLTVRNGSVYAEGLGGIDSNKGFLMGESPGAPAFGLVYDGTGAGGENKTHLKEFVGSDTTAVMTFKADGNVGVGTTTPDTKFEVVQSGDITSRITSTSSNDVRLEFKRSGGGSDWRINNTGGLLYFSQSSDDLASVTDILRLGGGSVTPATDNSVVCGQSVRRWTAVWAVNGTIQTSDASLKSNIQPSNAGLNIINQLNPVSYQWTDTRTDNGKTHIGFLAQDLQQVLPEAIYDHEWIQDPETGEREWTETHHLGINYSEIVPVLVKGIQEQQELIEQLSAGRNALLEVQSGMEARLGELQAENQQLRSEMEKINRAIANLQENTDQ